MKKIGVLLLVMFILLLVNGCKGKKTVSPPEPQVAIDTVAASDTGYTGIKQYMSNRYLIKEVTFKNGVRQGLMKAFYQTGEVRQTFWYENGLREDSSVWFYLEGQPFRTTPYKRDTIDGIQRQYYRTGRLKAKIGYSKGLRTTFFEEYTPEGRLVKNYPSLDVKITDEYKTKSKYTITLSLSDKATQVKYFRGHMSDGVFDTAHYEPVKSIKGIGNVELKKGPATKSSSIGVIAEIVTNFGNNYLIYKKIDLPYPDLK